MKAKTLRELAGDELEQKLLELRREHFEARRVKVTGKVENPLKLRLLRRDIARVRTLLRENKKA